MSRESVEIVRAGFEAINRLMAESTEDPKTSMREGYARFAAEFLAPDFEIVPAARAVERRTLRGIEGFVAFLEGGRDTWRGARLEAREFVDLGAEVLAIGCFRATGRASGVDIEQPNGTLWTVRDGRLSRVEVFLDPAEARAAAAQDR